MIPSDWKSLQDGDAARRGMMAKGQKKSNKEVRKPKAEKPKKNASNPSTKGMVADLKR
jgi:hypothetical protein